MVTHWAAKRPRPSKYYLHNHDHDITVVRELLNKQEFRAGVSNSSSLDDD